MRKRFPSLILDGYEFLFDNVVTSEGELVRLDFLDNVEPVGWEQAIELMVEEISFVERNDTVGNL